MAEENEQKILITVCLLRYKNYPIWIIFFSFHFYLWAASMGTRALPLGYHRHISIICNYSFLPGQCAPPKNPSKHAVITAISTYLNNPGVAHVPDLRAIISSIGIKLSFRYVWFAGQKENEQQPF